MLLLKEVPEKYCPVINTQALKDGKQGSNLLRMTYLGLASSCVKWES